MPLLDGGRHEAGVARADADLEVSLARNGQQILVAFRDVEDQLSALRTLRGELARAVQRMTAAVSHYFPPGTRITRPEGGFVLWVELPDHIDSFDLSQRALQDGISIAPGPIFSATGKYRNFIRLNSASWSYETDRAMERLGTLVAEQGDPGRKR